MRENTPIVFIYGNFNDTDYVVALLYHLLHLFEVEFIDKGDEVRLQQYNASFHTAKTIMEFVLLKNVNLLPRLENHHV